MTYEEFEQEFKKHHICGIPIIPYDLAYDSRCPKCCSDGGWELECKEFYSKGKIIRYNSYWYSQK